MRRLASLLLCATTFAFASAAQAFEDDGFRFTTFASGEQEIQPPGGVVTDTTATLRLDFRRDLSAAKFRLSVFEGRKITQAHLHCARAGANGPVVAFLFDVAPVPGPGGVNVDGRLARDRLTNEDIEPADFAANAACGVTINNIASLLTAVLDGIIYLNVHSEGNPPGEVRGQIFAVEGDDDDD